MKKLIPALLVLLIAHAGSADEATGPHGGKIVQNETHKFEVKIDSDSKHVEVFTLNAEKSPPKRMAITLFGDSGTGQSVDLKAMNLKDPLPRFQGELSPTAGSYVGAELKFGISLKSFTILKFIPYIPNRGSKP